MFQDVVLGQCSEKKLVSDCREVVGRKFFFVTQFSQFVLSAKLALEDNGNHGAIRLTMKSWYF
jgi:hypothetical protein